MIPFQRKLNQHMAQRAVGILQIQPCHHNLDNSIETAIRVAMPLPEFRHGNIDDVISRFTNIVYQTASKLCGVQTPRERKEKKSYDDVKKRQPAMLHKLRLLKRD